LVPLPAAETIKEKTMRVALAVLSVLCVFVLSFSELRRRPTIQLTEKKLVSTKSPFLSGVRLQDSEGSSLALTAIRAGAVGQTSESPLTLFVRIFIPSYGIDTSARKKKSLDPRERGLVGRIQDFLGALLGKQPVQASTKQAVTSTSKNSGSGSSSKTHFEAKFKPGNVNYRIQKELKEFVKSPPPNCKVSVGKDIRVWIVTITGAENTIYAGEKYKLRVSFPNDYPSKPPAVYFLKPTPRHAHCYTNGDICLSLLGKDWKPNLTVSSLALSILSMLSSAKEKKLPLDNAQHAGNPPGKGQDNFIYHDDNC